MEKITRLATLLHMTTAFSQELHLDQAKKIFELPTHCIKTEYH